MTGTTTRFTDKKSEEELDAIFKSVLEDFEPMNRNNPDTFIMLHNKSMKVSLAIEEIKKKTDVAKEIVNGWLENKEIFARSKRL
jgi:hypothetical protein